jgi:gas vesicle protein
MSGVLGDLLEEAQVMDIEEPTAEDKELTLTLQVEEMKAMMDKATIKDQKEYEAACEWLKEVKKKTKEVEAFYKPDKKKFYSLYKEIMDKTSKLTKILKVCETGVKNKIKEYHDEEARKQAEAQKKIEEERAKVEAARKEADPQKEGELAFTDPLSNLSAAPVVPAKAVQNNAGVVISKVWKWKVTDESQIPREYLILDEKKINGIVKGMKGDTNIPGIEAYEDSQVRA